MLFLYDTGLAQQYLTEHTESTEKNNLNFMNPLAASYLLIYGRAAVYTIVDFITWDKVFGNNRKRIKS